MKKNEIIKGHVYSNGKGRERKVLDIGPQYKLYAEQSSEDNLLYMIVRDGTKGNLSSGQKGHMTIAAFAAWAREDVSKDV